MTKDRSKKPKATTVVANGDTSDSASKQKAPKIHEKDAAEEELERLVFGDLAGFQAGLYADEEDADYSDDDADEVRLNFNSRGGLETVEELQDDQLFFVDSGSTQSKDLITQSNQSADVLQLNEGEEDLSEKPAWEDSDDERLRVSLVDNPRLRKLRNTELDDVISGKEFTKRLRRQYERINPVPEWALPASKERPKKSRRTEAESSEDEEDEVMDVDIEPNNSLASLLQLSSTYTKKSKSGKLQPENLDISRLRDANHLAPSQSAISSLSFHKTHPLLLSAGFDHVLRLYHIDKKTNPPATSLYIQGTPIQTATFHPDGKRVFAAGRRRYFHIWDLESGKVEKITRVYGQSDTQKSMEKFKLSPDGAFMALSGSHGNVNILDASTGQWIATAKVEGTVADLTWTKSGTTLFIANTGGEVWEWDSAERRISSRWVDEGGTGLTTISLGGINDRWCAIGSQSGVVNIYDRKSIAEGNSNPTPKRALGNLVTSINVLEFSEDGQLLCLGSKGKPDALRMVHLPSCTVFKNWPTQTTPIGRINCAAFAGASTGLFAFGNEGGKIRLWEVR